MDPLGYLVYLAFVILPGLGLGELLALWREKDSLAARLGYVFGLSLCIDTFVLVVKTSGIGPLAGVNSGVVYGTVAFGLVTLSVGLFRRRKLLFWVKPGRLDLAVVGAIVIQGLMILLYFQKYPIFPEYQTPDHAIHVQDALSLLSGSITTIPSGILYYGVHLQLATSLLLVGGSPLVTVRWTMALLAVLSPMLFYLAGCRLFGRPLAGAIAAVVYTLSASVWFGSVFDSGLYANFFGILVALFLVTAFLDSSSDAKGPGVWIALILAIVASYFSHYTILTVFPALLLYVLVQYAAKRRLPRRAALSFLLLVAPGALGVLVYPNFSGLLANVNSAGGTLIGGTLLSGALSGIPVLGYMALETYDDLAFVVLLLLAAVYVWRTFIMRSPKLALPLGWFAALMVASPLNTSAWRYSFEALVPLTLMAGFGLFVLLPQIDVKKGRRAAASTRRKAIAVLVLVLLPLLVGSWGTSMVSDATSGTAVYSQAQLLVNDSIAWLQSNTPHDASYLSVSDWRYTYTSILIDRPTTYVYMDDPAQALNYSESNGLDYIIVTNLVPTSVQTSPGELPWNTFPQNSTSELTVVYTNLDVRIYSITT